MNEVGIRKERLFIPVGDVDFGARGRKDYRNVDILADGIRDRGGLIHPIVVYEKPDKKGKYFLIAGGRRLTAHGPGYLNWETIEADVWPSDITPSELKRIELTENIHRENLTWQEEVDLTREINEFESELDPTHTLEKTAAILGKSVATVSADISLSKAKAELPALNKAKKKTDAAKTLQQVKEEIYTKELARRAEREQANTPTDETRKKMRNGFRVGDCLEGMSKLKNNCVQFIELDPPYGIDFGKLVENTHSHVAQGSFEGLDEAEYAGFMGKLIPECYRILDSRGWIVVWLSFTTIGITQRILEEAGFELKRSPLIWIKPEKTGRCRIADENFTIDYELMLYARKGRAKLNKQGPSSQFRYELPKNKVHPTEKPVKLIERLIETFCPPGGITMSPCLGSGNTIIAAANLGLYAFGWDLSEEFRDSFSVRVSEWEPKTLTSSTQES